MAVDYEQARERVYGMPYAEWKSRYQTEARCRIHAELPAPNRAEDRAYDCRAVSWCAASSSSRKVCVRRGRCASWRTIAPKLQR